MPTLNHTQPANAAPGHGEAPPLDLSHQHDEEPIRVDGALKPGAEPAFDAPSLRLLAAIDPAHTAALCAKLLASKTGGLPDGFDQWGLKDRDGRTLAHVAASRGRLPKDFSQWGLKDKDGKTVAHVAVACGRLPKGFSQWDLTDGDGWTVAHEAAKRRRLPRDFNQWGLEDKDGRTVASWAVWNTCEARRDPTEGSLDDS